MHFEQKAVMTHSMTHAGERPYRISAGRAVDGHCIALLGFA